MLDDLFQFCEEWSTCDDHFPYAMAQPDGGTSSFTRELEINDKTIRIKQLYIGDVGCVVWDAAIVLCKFLENENYFPAPADEVGSHSHSQISRSEIIDAPSYWNGKRVIDLGSGTGVVGIAAGVLGYKHTPHNQSQLFNNNLSYCTLKRRSMQIWA